MAHDNAESYHPVPSVRRARAKNPIGGSAGGGKTNLTDEHGPVTRTEVEKHDDGTAHVTAHHAKGHVEVHQHPNLEAAHEHAHSLMSGGDAMNSEGKVEDGSQDGEECPSCGATMQDGKCPQCGYESKPAAGGGDEDADDGY
jgi:hypothetical protein